MAEPECSVQLYDNNIRSHLLSRFFTERKTLIQENKHPTMLVSDPACRLVFYVVPESFEQAQIDIGSLEHPDNYFIPLGEPQNTIICDFNFEGALFLSSIHIKHAYTQVFRDAKVETVVALTRFANDSRDSLLPLLKLQKSLPSCVQRHLSLLKKLGVAGPYYLYFHLLDSDGIRIDPKDISFSGFDTKGRNKTLLRDHLNFPIFKMINAQVDVQTCLKPLFDIFWNTFGFAGAPKINF